MTLQLNNNDKSAEAGLLNTRLMLSSSFRCDQIYKYELYDFGNTLLCYLSRTKMFNKLASEMLFSVISKLVVTSPNKEPLLKEKVQYG